MGAPRRAGQDRRRPSASRIRWSARSTLRYESFTVNGAPGQMLVVYHAEPGSEAERALALLSSIAADEAAPRSASAEAST